LNPNTISALLQARRSENPALLAPNRRPLSFAGLYDQVERTVAAINRLGIGRNDRVAMVLRNGPEMASAFLGVAAGASSAPLNPELPAADFGYLLAELDAKAILVERNSASPAIAAAKSLKIPILELASCLDDPAGTFSVIGSPVGPSKADGFAAAEDIALVLHTSGTIANPKMVPLSQHNLTASAGHIVQTLLLSPQDRSLNIMPLFHIHGLVAGLLSPLAAGGSIFCTPGFNVLEFFGWLSEAKPSWYTAVP
jgi:acyl-CoA synthetase (AMP-forming)/AMP-acid ligase II